MPLSLSMQTMRRAVGALIIVAIPSIGSAQVTKWPARQDLSGAAILGDSFWSPLLSKEEMSQEQIRTAISSLAPKQVTSGVYPQLFLFVTDRKGEHFGFIRGDLAVSPTKPPLSVAAYRLRDDGCPMRIWSTGHRGFGAVEALLTDRSQRCQLYDEDSRLPVKLMFKGTDIARTLSKVRIGEPIKLEIQFPSMEVIKLDQMTWRLPPRAMARLDITNKACVAKSCAPTRPRPVNASTIEFYFQAESPEEMVTFHYSIDGRSSSVAATFAVETPTVAFEETHGEVVLRYAFAKRDGEKLQLEVIPPLAEGVGVIASWLVNDELVDGLFLDGAVAPGVTLHASTDSGQLMWVQTAKAWVEHRYMDGRIEKGCADGLDMIRRSGALQDTPGSVLRDEFASTTMTFAARSHLLWRSPSEGAIFVPIGFVDWGWAGEAERGGDRWRLKSSKLSGSWGLTKQLRWPVWTKRAQVARCN